MQFRNAPLVAIVILTLITPLVCSGASYASLDYPELWRESDAIVVGTVAMISSEGGGYFSIDVEVDRYVKNLSEASSIVIHYHIRTNFERAHCSLTSSVTQYYNKKFSRELMNFTMNDNQVTTYPHLCTHTPNNSSESQLHSDP